MNYFIDHINDCLIDGIDLNKYDFYKSQYIYLTFLYFDSIHYEKIEKNEVLAIDSYLDNMRDGIDNNYFLAFVTNAKNRYYNLNPYGILCPINEIMELYEFIDVLNAHSFDEKLSLVIEVISAIKKLINEIKRDDIPHKDRLDILEDSDYKSIRDFFLSIKDGRIDDTTIIKEKRLENILTDILNLTKELQGKRD